MKLKVNKRFGFTLVELLVTMFIATVALTMITGTVIFMSKANDELIEVSQNTYKIQIIMDKIHSEEYSTKDDYEYKTEQKTLTIVLDFDENEKLQNFSYMYTSF